jgi:hypothetical protein
MSPREPRVWRTERGRVVSQLSHAVCPVCGTSVRRENERYAPHTTALTLNWCINGNQRIEED